MSTARPDLMEPKAVDAMPPRDALTAMLASHQAAVASVTQAIASIEAAAALVAKTLSTGHTLYYAAAGSSGLMALADGCELPGTFGVSQHQIRVCMAGGVPADGKMPGNTEDDTSEAEATVKDMKDGDLAIVVSASGTTPFALAFARSASARGHDVVAIANVAGCPLLTMSDVAIALHTGPEIIEGSTRLGAGTAQKVALNMISTQAGVLMGHVHDGLMVNLIPDNIKLRQRAITIVTRITGVETDLAKAALETACWDTKTAILIASGQRLATAQDRLRRNRGNLRACLSANLTPT